MEGDGIGYAMIASHADGWCSFLLYQAVSAVHSQLFLSKVSSISTVANVLHSSGSCDLGIEL